MHTRDHSPYTLASTRNFPMLRPGHIRLPKDEKAEAAEAERATGFARKQAWKALPGNRYTAEELRAMSGRLGTLAITETEPEIMRLD